MKKISFLQTFKRAVAISVASLVLGVSASGWAANFYATNSGNFMDHGFVVNSYSAASISNVVNWLRQRDFQYQFENITAVNSDGTMNADNYTTLSNWIQVSRATDPNQKIIAYISGTENNVNAGQACWSNIASVCQMFLTNYGVDGVNLDFEPFETTVTNYVGFFKTVRNVVGTNAFLSLDYTADPSAIWSPADFKAASAYINWMMPMLYDSSSTTIDRYDAFVTNALIYEYTNLAPGCQLYPIIPYYATDPYHDTNIENIETASIAITNLINDRKIKINGISVWWYYGWDNTADIQWSNYWLNVQLPVVPPPAISSLVPTNGPPAGGTHVNIYGSNFVSGDTVQFGSATPVSANYVNATNLTATTPANAAGTVNVKVADFYGQTSILPDGYFFITPPAKISSFSLMGRNLVLVWQGGTNENCTLLTSTNVSAPVAAWTSVATNTVGANGLSTNIISINSNRPVSFYLLVLPY